VSLTPIEAISTSAYQAMLPELTLLSGIVLMIIATNLGDTKMRIPLTNIRVPVFFGGRRFEMTADPRIPGYICVMTLALSAVLALMSQPNNMLHVYYTGHEGYLLTTDNGTPLLQIDAFSRLFELMFYVVLLIAAISSLDTMNAVDSRKVSTDNTSQLVNNRRQIDFHLLILLSAFGMSMVAMSVNLFMLFLGLELASLAIYVLVAFHKESKAGSEAGVKYFIVGATASAVGFYGMSLLYLWNGDLGILSLQNAWRGMEEVEALPLIALGLLLVGFGFKISAVPFHFVAPDAYAGASSQVAGILATASKAMGFIALMRVLFLVTLPETNSTAVWLMLMGGLAAVTMTWGNLAALTSTNPKRMLAYSSVAHAGYMLAALTAVGAWRWGHFASGTAVDAVLMLTAAVIFHLFVLVTFKLGAFLVLGLVDMEGESHDMKSLNGLAKRDPMVAFSMFIFMLALAGVPPLAGFMSKFLMASGIIQVTTSETGIELSKGLIPLVQDLHWTFWLALLIFLNSALSLFYYLRIGVLMFFEEPETKLPLPRASKLRAMIWVCTVGAIVFGISSDWLFEFAKTAADAFFNY